jgi:rSAM/selenodomain-associated transferase 1
MTDALIIFVRHPELGKVKTRIGDIAGAAFALEVYQRLLQHTHAITMELDMDKYVYYAGDLCEHDIWSNRRYHKARQEGTNLGTRMRQAFEAVFGKGYQRVCIIGSDCYELTTSLIVQAFEGLSETDFVIGPAKDGGYYLLGMRNGVKNVFQHIEWSTDKVLQQTLAQISPPFQYTLLPQLADVDTLEDVPDSWKEQMMSDE